MLVAPPGCGKTATCMAVYDELQRRGKEVHYVYQPGWADGPGRGPWRMNAELRDLFVRASERVDLLIIDEADRPTIEAMASLRLHCPVLVVARPDALDGGSASASVVMDLGPSGGWMPFGPCPPVNDQD
ncbi:ATP-binding protein [Streptomyces pseudogriseolus]|uniref:ATP-binding protein n=1 Tax=Streptomyces pseudogriseolus TaxID=36817 RepID=UPI003470F12A